MINVELLQLKYFKTVARLEHMTEAAKELKIAQPSLSKTISRLEEDLGVPLFDREGRKIRLNSYGKLFLARVNRVFFELAEGRKEIQNLSGLDFGTVKLAVSIPSILPELISSYLVKHPKVHFQQLMASNASMQHLLEKGEIDLCITSSPINGPEIEWVPLLTEEIFLMVPTGHYLAQKRRIRLIEAQNESFISSKKGIRETESYCQQAGFKPNISFEGDDTLVIARLIQSGLGIGFVPALIWFFAPHESVALLRISEPVLQRNIGIARSKRHHASLAAHDFFQYTIEYFSGIAEKLKQLGV